MRYVGVFVTAHSNLPMRYMVLLNPAAGHGRVGRSREKIERALREAGLDVHVVETQSAEQTAVRACEAACSGGAVIAVGGDGTVHHVARGVAEGGSGALGVIPLGTGNDFARMLGMPRNLRAAALALRAAVPVPMDYGVVRWWEGGRPAQRRFVNAVGIGFDAQVAREVVAFKALPGFTGYLAAVLRTLRHWQAPSVVVATGKGGRPVTCYTGPLLLATVGNGATSGGGFRLTPEASLTDGLFDLCLIQAAPARRVLQLLPHVLRGRHGAAPEVQMHHARHVHLQTVAGEGVRPPQGLPIHADGEVLTEQAGRVEIDIVAGGLSVLMPTAPFSGQAQPS